jgi:hypothetical protein
MRRGPARRGLLTPLRSDDWRKAAWCRAGQRRFTAQCYQFCRRTSCYAEATEAAISQLRASRLPGPCEIDAGSHRNAMPCVTLRDILICVSSPVRRAGSASDGVSWHLKRNHIIGFHVLPTLVSLCETLTLPSSSALLSVSRCESISATSGASPLCDDHLSSR